MDEALRELPGRLDVAFRRWQEAAPKRDKKVFASAMKGRLEGRGLKAGGSYQTLLNYFEGTFTPSLEWLSEASDELGVRLPWLALNSGPMTPEEEARADAVSRLKAAASEEGPDDDDLWLKSYTRSHATALAAALRKTPWMRDVLMPKTGPAYSLFHHVEGSVGVRMQVKAAPDDDPTYWDAPPPPAERHVFAALLAPLSELGLDPQTWPPERRKFYVISILTTLATLLELEEL
jgi:hypothetical protein